MILQLPLWIWILVFPSSNPDNKGPRLLWSDEFNYTGSPDTTRWTYDIGNGCPAICGWGNAELQYYTRDRNNIRVEEGKLIIEAHRQVISGSSYASAKIKTLKKASWKYAYVEVRAKLPQGRGTWPAIWMLPDTNAYGGWPASGEIDIMEHVGFDPGIIHGTVHTTDFNHMKGTQVGKQKEVVDFSTAFHTYAINWTANRIEFYIDGAQYHEFKNNGTGAAAWPFDHAFHLILNIAVGGGWGGAKGIDESIWPQRMEVDHVRVYEPLYTDNEKNVLFDMK